jgi:Skp family chaperone for outer membrane proteins
MKFIAYKALFASLMLAAPMMIGGQANAQARSVAVVDPDTVIGKSSAYTTAMTQIQTTYKAQIDQVNTRSAALNAELKPLVDAFNVARSAPNATEQSVQPSYDALQKKKAAADQEIGRLSQSIQLARAYVLEQIEAQFDAAVRAAMRTKAVDLVLASGAAIAYQPAADISAAVTTELNRLLPSVQIVPPAGWQPGQKQQAAAPAQAQQKPQGR